MHKVNEKRFNKKIIKDFSYSFGVNNSGLYLIEVTASAKSWWQNFINLHSFFKDDDLTIKIDGRAFPKLDGRRGLFDGEVAWNGNNLKGLSKTNAFFIYLDKGEHELYFFSDQKPILEQISIYSLEKEKEIPYSPLNNPSQDGNRRQWITLVAVDLSVKSLNITAKAQRGRAFSLFRRDDSDIKLIIDGKVQRNNEAKSHKYWFWCGRTLKGSSKTFSQNLNLRENPLHYIELWADRTPQIEEIKLSFSENTKSQFKFRASDIQTYTYRGVSGTEDYNKFDEEIVDAVNKWNDEFFAQKYPPPERLHPNLVKAMIYIESRMGYEKVEEGFYDAYPDVMQVADPRNPAIHTMLEEADYMANEFIFEEEYGHMSYNYPADRAPNGDTLEDSIFWGVRWLYHKAQYLPQITQKPYSREWRPWNEAVRNYNKKNNFKYEKEVYDAYENGVDKRSKKYPVKLWVTILALIGISYIGAVFGMDVRNNQGRVWLTEKHDLENGIQYSLSASIVDGLRTKTTEISKYHNHRRGMFDFKKDGNPAIYPRDLFGDEEYEFVVVGSDSIFLTPKEIVPDYYMIWYILKKTEKGLEIVQKKGSEFSDDIIKPAFKGSWLNFIDLDGDGTFEVRESALIPYSNAVDQVWHSWYRYNATSGLYEFVRRDKEEDPEARYKIGMPLNTVLGE